jgi:hypothetical protein
MALECRMNVTPRLETRLAELAARRDLEAAARRAIAEAGKGYQLYYLSFRFKGMTIAISTRLTQSRELVIDADLAPDERIRVIAEEDASIPRRPMKSHGGPRHSRR